MAARAWRWWLTGDVADLIWEVVEVQILVFGLLVLAFLYAAVRAIFGWPVTDFGSVAITDGYSTPQTLLPNSYGDIQYYSRASFAALGNQQGFLAPYAGTITAVQGYAATQPTGASVIFDVKKNGVTMFTTTANRPTIAVSTSASSTTLPDIVAFAAGDWLTIDVLQVGSTLPGAVGGLVVTFKRALSA